MHVIYTHTHTHTHAHTHHTHTSHTTHTHAPTYIHTLTDTPSNMPTYTHPHISIRTNTCRPSVYKLSWKPISFSNATIRRRFTSSLTVGNCKWLPAIRKHSKKPESPYHKKCLQKRTRERDRLVDYNVGQRRVFVVVCQRQIKHSDIFVAKKIDHIVPYTHWLLTVYPLAVLMTRIYMSDKWAETFFTKNSSSSSQPEILPDSWRDFLSFRPLSHINNSSSQNIGGRMHGPSPHFKVWMTVPQSPPSLRPWSGRFLKVQSTWLWFCIGKRENNMIGRWPFTMFSLLCSPNARLSDPWIR